MPPPPLPARVGGPPPLPGSSPVAVPAAKAGASDRRAGLDAVNPGQLAEAIPRSMRLWVPEKIEVRIARRTLDGLAAGLEGRGPVTHHDIVITSAMSVRLKAPDGGLAIDSVSPETQWIENRPGLLSSDEFASWRWTVRPLRKGRARLHLIVSARTAAPDGSTAETALPDQIIELKVRANYGLAVKRWTGWVTAAILGGALAKFGEGGFELLRNLAGL